MTTQTFMYGRGTRDAVIDALEASGKVLDIYIPQLQRDQLDDAVRKCIIVRNAVTYALDRMDLDEHVLVGLPTTTPGGAA